MIENLKELVLMGCKDTKPNSTKDFLCKLTDKFIESEKDLEARKIASKLNERLDRRKGIDLRTPKGRRRVYDDLKKIESRATDLEGSYCEEAGKAIADLDEVWEQTITRFLDQDRIINSKKKNNGKDLKYNFNEANFELLKDKSREARKK